LCGVGAAVDELDVALPADGAVVVAAPLPGVVAVGGFCAIAAVDAIAMVVETIAAAINFMANRYQFPFASNIGTPPTRGGFTFRFNRR